MSIPKPTSDSYSKHGIFRRYAKFSSVHPALKNTPVGLATEKLIAKIKAEKQVPAKGIAIYGEPGTGKTGCMMLIAKAAADLCNQNEKLTMRCFTFWQFVGFVRNSFGGKGYSISDLAGENDFLFIDDVGKCLASPEWLADSFQELVDTVYNYGEGKSLMITSNLSRAGLAETFGNPCLDRIDELCKSFELTGRSLR